QCVIKGTNISAPTTRRLFSKSPLQHNICSTFTHECALHWSIDKTELLRCRDSRIYSCLRMPS
uniref:Ovule protein n=1 Tax=Ascaris lumbricoides TaxID=6252 RepID=A0A0M3HGZ0_ASCLU